MSHKDTLFYRQKQRYSFNCENENLSTDGGAVLLEKVERKHKILKNFSSQLPDNRCASRVDFTYNQILKQRVFLLVQGYQDCNDVAYLKNDSLIKDMLESDLCSQPTLSRFENSFSIRDVYNLCTYWVENYVESIDSKRDIITIDVDGTDDPTHGNQQLSLYNGYYGQTMYNELFFHDGDTGQIILPVLRPGNVHSNRWFVKILSKIIDKIRVKFPDKIIRLRADGGFSGPAFYDLVEQKNIQYCVGMTANSVLKKKTAFVEQAVSKTFVKENEKHQHFIPSFKYKAESWTKEQDCYAKIESTGKGLNVRYFSSNIPNLSGREIYKEIYTKRGDASENRIKEVKNMCYSGRLSCHYFVPNFIRLFMSSLAYEMFVILKKYIKQTTDDAAKKWQIDNIRLFLLKVGATIKNSIREVKINFSKSYICKYLFQQIINLV